MNCTDWAGCVQLNAIEFQACWTELEIGDTPLALELRPPGNTFTARQRIYTDALAALHRRGLADRSVSGGGPFRPGPRLTEILRLLAGAPREWDLRLTGGLVAIGAAWHERGVVVVRDRPGPDRRIALLPVPGPSVPSVLVDLLGPVHPGPMRPVNIPGAALVDARRTARDGNLWTLADRLVERGVDRKDADSLARMCTGITAAGQLGGIRRVGAVEHRTPWVVGFHRSRAGDFVQLRRRGPDGSDTVTIAPATAERLTAQVRELVPAD